MYVRMYDPGVQSQTAPLPQHGQRAAEQPETPKETVTPPGKKADTVRFDSSIS